MTSQQYPPPDQDNFQRTAQGPLPNPDFLRRYEEISPGSAEQIIKMWEQQVAHRQQLELEVAKSEIRTVRLGIAYALLLNVAILIGAVALILNGHDTIGGLLAIVNITSLLGSVILNATMRPRSRPASNHSANPSSARNDAAQ